MEYQCEEKQHVAASKRDISPFCFGAKETMISSYLLVVILIFIVILVVFVSVVERVKERDEIITLD